MHTVENAPARPDAFVVEGTDLAVIQAATEAKLHQSVSQLTRMIEGSRLSADALGMAEAIRKACRAELDSRYAR